jgi:integrase/recombinase XerD
VTLISLLAATGLRISEALALQVSDLSGDGLLIRKTKFQKTRLVPLHATAVTGLEHYLRHPQRRPSTGPWIFVTERGDRLAYREVHAVFRRLVSMAQLRVDGGRPPTLHGLRHTFAVRALEATPTGRSRVGQSMRALATYLGHVSIVSTYWYLEATPELLADVATASERFVSGGQP